LLEVLIRIKFYVVDSSVEYAWCKFILSWNSF